MSEKDFKRSSSRQSKSYEEETFQTFCKQMLKTRVFKGCYQERRYVEQLKSYRDLIVIDKDEHELMKDLEYLKNRINGFYKGHNLWVGISLPNMIGAPAANICIWTEISDIALGRHWFYIKTMKFRENEVIIKLTSLRSAEDVATGDGIFTRSAKKSNLNENSTETKTTTTGHQNNDNINNDDGVSGVNDFVELLTSWKDGIKATLLTFLSREINKENITSTVKFVCLVIVSLLTFSIEAIKFIGTYSLRFMAECRLWIHVSTPIIIKLIELITKIIGGFYILIAMLWRDTVGGGTSYHVDHTRMLPPAASENRNNSIPPRRLSGQEYYRNLHYNRSGSNINNNRRHVF